MILTIENYINFQKLAIANDFESEFEGIKALTGETDVKSSEYETLKQALVQQLKPGTPIYMFKWKGKTYGYYPADIESIGQVVQVSNSSIKNKWNILASMMFREVTATSGFLHRKFGFTKKIAGISCKPITTFKNNYLTYACKKLPEWNKMDHRIWDDFPVYILMSNLNFSLGSGLNLSLNIPTSSHNETQVILQRSFQTLMGCIASSWTLQRIQDSIQRNSDGMTLQKYHPENSLISSFSENLKLLKLKMHETANTLTGFSKVDEIDAFIKTLTNIFDDEQLHPSTLRLIGTVNNAIKI